MFKIIMIDDNKQERVAASDIPTIEEAVKKMVALADAKAATLPNNPRIDISGPNEITIYIGLYGGPIYRVVSA